MVSVWQNPAVPRLWCLTAAETWEQAGQGKRRLTSRGFYRDLYVLALLELQGVNESDVLSYFQIMGAERLALNDTVRTFNDGC